MSVLVLRGDEVREGDVVNGQTVAMVDTSGPADWFVLRNHHGQTITALFATGTVEVERRTVRDQVPCCWAVPEDLSRPGRYTAVAFEPGGDFTFPLYSEPVVMDDALEQASKHADRLIEAVDPAAGFWEQATSSHLEAEYPESVPARRHENVRTDLV